ncbi:CueP family metal-binding protein [Isoptericola haloaureus]|uniref:CueP family metal-binding protein n=1 Tax=Isoptericola haloaureus TaxID=1542902 RepID=A0ABU7Z5C6_9MICO
MLLHRARQRALLTLTASLAALTLAACSAGEPTPSTDDETAAADTASSASLTDAGLDGLDGREIVDTLDALPLAERPTDLMVSVRPDELLVTTADEGETTVSLEGEDFYVSIAPYVDQTHECYFHSLTTCTGELQNAEVDVLVTDDATGEVVLDETRTTFDNGFVGLWLPRDLDATVTIEHDGMSASSPLSTAGADDATCVTTMQLT